LPISRETVHRSPQDEAQLANSIVDELTIDESESKPEKNLAAVALRKLSGFKGGMARAEKLSPNRRKVIAKKAEGQMV